MDVQVSGRCEVKMPGDGSGERRAVGNSQYTPRQCSRRSGRSVFAYKEWAQRQRTRAEEVEAIAKAMEILKEEAVKEALLQDTAHCWQHMRVQGFRGGAN